MPDNKKAAIAANPKAETNPYVKDTFNPTNEEHTHYVMTKVGEFTQKLEQLQAVDDAIFKAGAAAGISLIAKFIPLVGALMPNLFVIGANSYLIHQFYERNHAQKQYQTVFKELRDTYKWVMSKNAEQNLQSVTVQSLMLTLAPWVSYQTFLKCSDDDELQLPESKLSVYTAFNMFSNAISFFRTEAKQSNYAKLSREQLLEKLSEFTSDTHCESTAYQFYGQGNSTTWLSYVQHLSGFYCQVALTAAIEKTPELIGKLPDLYQQVASMKN